MIKSLVMPQIPFSDCETIQLGKYNFIFGNNGTGKSSIARTIFKEYSSSNFKNLVIDSDSEIIVYDKDFSKRNFKDKKHVPGVYLLGENAGEIETEIKELEDSYEKLETRINGLKTTKANFEGEMRNRDVVFIETCWGVAEAQRKKFSVVLDGRKQKASFYQYCLDNYTGEQTEISEDRLSNDISRVFATNLEAMNFFEHLQATNINKAETNPIFLTTILSEDNYDFNDLIKNLGNSDWVYNGLKYLDRSSRKCPFCQQLLTDELTDIIRSVFSAKYEKDMKVLEEAANQYLIQTDDILNYVYFIQQEKVVGFDYAQLTNLNDLLKVTIAGNIRSIDEKKKEPSRITELESIIPIIISINDCIKSINALILENNLIVKSKRDEQNKLTKRTIDYIANKVLYAVIREYKEQSKKQQQILDGIDEKINIGLENFQNIKRRIRELKSSVSSIERTLEFMQKTMDTIGFTSFRIVAAEDGKAFRIVRHDGSCVDETLSEGEFGFISFLYFFYLIVGSKNADLSEKKKIVVIDDPISSLDSNGLFYVSGLIDQTIKKYSIKGGIVEQLIILTHNAYFLKQLIAITNDKKLEKAKFFLIEKSQTCSVAYEVDKKQFESSYESLWRIVLNSDSKNSQMVLNAMRRIIEDFIINYVGKNKYDLCNELPPEHQSLYRTLLIITNAGSHDVPDDFAFYTCGKDIKGYLDVFREVFSAAGFEEHYVMMQERVKETKENG